MLINIDDLTLKQIKEFQSVNNSVSKEEMYEVGKSYFIRTVTMHHIGTIKKITPKEIMLVDAAWVADSGRFSDALLTGKLSEVEPFPDYVIIGREAIIDATPWRHKLPSEQI